MDLGQSIYDGLKEALDMARIANSAAQWHKLAVQVSGILADIIQYIEKQEDLDKQAWHEHTQARLMCLSPSQIQMLLDIRDKHNK